MSSQKYFSISILFVSLLTVQLSYAVQIKAVDVSGGENHSMVLREDGGVAACRTTCVRAANIYE